MNDDDSTVPLDNKITPVKDILPSGNINSQVEEAIVKRIPIYEEKFDVTKELTKTQLYLEKRWIKSTKKIEIPVNYEELFINGKEFDSYSHNELVEIFSKVKEKISEVFHPSQTEGDGKRSDKRENKDNRHYPDDVDITLKKDDETTKVNMSQIENKASIVEKKRLPLPNPEASTTNSQIQVSNDNNDNNNDEEEKIIPIWGEQIILDKKMVKLGEIVIKKSKITEKRKVDVEVIKEKITVKHPDGKKEDIN